MEQIKSIKKLLNLFPLTKTFQSKLHIKKRYKLNIKMLIMFIFIEKIYIKIKVTFYFYLFQTMQTFFPQI